MTHRTLGRGASILALTATALLLVTSLALACESEKSAATAAARSAKSCLPADRAVLETAAVTPAIAPASGGCGAKPALAVAGGESDACAYTKVKSAGGRICESMDAATCAAMMAAGHKCPEGMSARTAAAKKADHCKEGGACPYSAKKKAAGASVEKAPAKKVSKDG
jgi:hypothetical protein